jgi:hypothetical protein
MLGKERKDGTSSDHVIQLCLDLFFSPEELCLYPTFINKSHRLDSTAVNKQTIC